MLDSKISALVSLGQATLDKRASLLSYWQECAENFYLERADFTTNRTWGETFGDNLTTSYPLLARREFADNIGSMLRPNNKQWFDITVDDIEDVDVEGRVWLERATRRQRAVMYARETLFERSTKGADNDFSVFGQAVIQKVVNSAGDNLLYKLHHLRDVAWLENYDGQVDTIFNRRKVTARDLNRIYKGNVSDKVKNCLEKSPNQLITCFHIIVPNNGDYQLPSGKTIIQPYVSISVDVENGFLLDMQGSWDKQYIVIRWALDGCSQYAYSPCVVTALEDARLIQDISLTLLEAGQKAVSPPMIATSNAVNGDINLYSNGITWLDDAYDERLGDALRPLTQNLNGLPVGLEMQQDLRGQIAKAFYLDKLTFPMMSGERTAYEIGVRVSEYIRNALPLFAPLEADYNGQLCEMTFNDLFRRGTFGRPNEIPESLAGKEVKFKFTSPLSQALGAEKSQKLMEDIGVLGQAAQVDPNVKNILNVKRALNDVYIGTKTPAIWLNTEDEIAQIEQAEAEAAQMKQAVAMAQQGGQAAESMSRVAVNMNSIEQGAQ
jgi:hypothetical protein